MQTQVLYKLVTRENIKVGNNVVATLDHLAGGSVRRSESWRVSWGTERPEIAAGSRGAAIKEARKVAPGMIVETARM